MELIQGEKKEEDEIVLTIRKSDLKNQQRWLEVMLIFAELVKIGELKKESGLTICH